MYWKYHFRLLLIWIKHFLMPFQTGRHSISNTTYKLREVKSGSSSILAILRLIPTTTAVNRYLRYDPACSLKITFILHHNWTCHNAFINYVYSTYVTYDMYNTVILQRYYTVITALPQIRQLP